MRLDQGELALNRGPTVHLGALARSMLLEGFLDRDLDHFLGQGFLDRLEDDLIEDLLFDQQGVFADRGTPLPVVRAPVKPALLPVIVSSDDLHRPATVRASRHAGEEVFAISISKGRPGFFLVSCEAGFDRRPELRRDDPEIRRVEADHVLGLSFPPSLGPAADNLLQLAVDDLALVERSMENFADRTRRPTSRALPSGRHLFGVQPFGDPPDPQAAGIHLVDLADDRRLFFVDDPEDVEALTGRRADLFVVVPEHFSAGDMPGLRFAEHRVIGPLLRPFALHLGGEVCESEHHLVGRTLKRPFSTFQVKEQPDAGIDDLLERVGCLDRFTAEPRLLGHDQDLERRPRLERVHEP